MIGSPAAMHLTLLLSLFAVTVCADATTSSATELATKSATGSTAGRTPPVSRPSKLAPPAVASGRTEADHASPPAKTPMIDHTSTGTPVTRHTSTGTPIINQTSTKTPTIDHTSTGTPVMNQTSTETPTIDHTSTGTLVTKQTVSSGPTGSATSPVLSHQKDGSLASRPGLVAIVCILCIVLFLTLVVAILKCTSQSRTNFERLEDVPMGRVDEGSPFAHHPK